MLHHSEYIERLILEDRLHLQQTDTRYTYHDPCELGRGQGIYQAPRSVISAAGTLHETEHNRANALCCGASLANTVINDTQQQTIAMRMTQELEATGCDTIATACPLCNKAIARASTIKVEDIAEIVAKNLNKDN